MSIIVWQVIAIGAIAISLVGYFAIGRGRTLSSSSRFGPRYDRTVGVPDDHRDEPNPTLTRGARTWIKHETIR
jgi:hypothetical protein